MATYKNLFIDQGSDFSFSADQSIDLTNYTARGQIRKSYTSTNATDFTIIVDVSNGKLDVSLSATQTGALKAGRYVYDIEILSDDTPAVVTRVLEGQIDVTPRVTVG